MYVVIGEDGEMAGGNLEVVQARTVQIYQVIV